MGDVLTKDLRNPRPNQVDVLEVRRTYDVLDVDSDQHQTCLEQDVDLWPF